MERRDNAQNEITRTISSEYTVSDLVTGKRNYQVGKFKQEKLRKTVINK